MALSTHEEKPSAVGSNSAQSHDLSLRHNQPSRSSVVALFILFDHSQHAPCNHGDFDSATDHCCC